MASDSFFWRVGGSTKAEPKVDGGEMVGFQYNMRLDLNFSVFRKYLGSL